MRKVRVGNNQSIYDIAVQEYGSLDAVSFLMSDNHIGVTGKLVPGTLLMVRDTPLDAVTVRQLRARGVSPAAGDAYRVDEWTLQSVAGTVSVLYVRINGRVLYSRGNDFYQTSPTGEQHVDTAVRATHIDSIQDKTVVSTRLNGVYIYGDDLVPSYSGKLDVALSSLVSNECYFHGLVTGDKLVVGTNNGISVGTWAGLSTTFTTLVAGIDVRSGVTVNGKAYMATDEGIKIYDGTSITTWDVSKDLPTNNIRKVYVDSRGVIWATTQTDGLIRITVNEDIIVNNTDGILAPSNHPTAVVEDRLGRMYITWVDGTNHYHTVINNGEWSTIKAPASGVPNALVNAMAHEPLRDNIYYGLSTLGLYLWDRHPLLNS